MSTLTLRGNASGTGTFIVESPNSNTSRTISLPDASTTLVGTDATQTLTNKTISGATVSGSTINGGALTLMTAKAWNWNALTTNTFLDFESIPSWVRRITVMCSDIGFSTAGVLQVQLGDSGGIENTGYVSACDDSVTISNSATGFVVVASGNVAWSFSGAITISLLSGNTWVSSGNLARVSSGVGNANLSSSGVKTLSTTLDRLRLTSTGGTDVFDSGTVNVMYEG